MAKYEQREIDEFMKKLTQWSKTLPAHEQQLLRSLLAHAKDSGELSEDALERVSGGIIPPKGWLREG